jgi:hypothetical protein
MDGVISNVFLKSDNNKIPLAWLKEGPQTGRKY